MGVWVGVCNPLPNTFICVQLVCICIGFLWRGVSIFAQHCNFKKAHSESIYIQQNVHKNLSHTPYYPIKDTLLLTHTICFSLTPPIYVVEKLAKHLADDLLPETTLRMSDGYS